MMAIMAIPRMSNSESAFEAFLVLPRATLLWCDGSVVLD